MCSNDNDTPSFPVEIIKEKTKLLDSARYKYRFHELAFISIFIIYISIALTLHFHQLYWKQGGVIAVVIQNTFL